MYSLSFILVVLLLPAKLTSSQETNNERYVFCRKSCADYEQYDLQSSVCQGALQVPPTPGVYKSCMNGKRLAFEHACMPACTGNEYRGRNIEPGNSNDACKSERKNPRPNNQLPWCRKGYDKTYDKVRKDIIDKYPIRTFEEKTIVSTSLKCGDKEDSASPSQCESVSLNKHAKDEAKDIHEDDQHVNKLDESLSHQGTDETDIDTNVIDTTEDLKKGMKKKKNLEMKDENKTTKSEGQVATDSDNVDSTDSEKTLSKKQNMIEHLEEEKETEIAKSDGHQSLADQANTKILVKEDAISKDDEKMKKDANLDELLEIDD